MESKGAELQGLGRRAGVYAGVGLVLALALLLATSSADLASARRALLLVAVAIVAAVVAPFAAATTREGPPRERPSPRERSWTAAAGGAAAALGLTAGAAVPALLALGGDLAAGFAWVALWGAALGVLAAALGSQLAASALGLTLVALPHIAGSFTAGLDGDAGALALRGVVRTPLPTLAGTFAHVDVLRGNALYRAFPLGQALPWAYPSAVDALATAGAALIAALGLLATRAGAARALRRLAPRPPAGLVPAALALGLLLIAPAQARAQGLFPDAGGPGAATDSPIGDLQTRVELGYWVPVLRGEAKFDGRNDVPGAHLSFRRVLELDPIFLLPTFEVHLTWANAGRLSLQYIESAWEGETNTGFTERAYEETALPPQNFVDSRYKFRSIALGGGLQIPLTDFLTIEVMTTQRYVKHELTARAFPARQRLHNSIEALMPTFGLGADVFIWNVISIYGSIQWLDFRTSWFGGEDGRWEFRYREMKAGVRLELIEHAHVGVEFYSLETIVVDGGRDRFDQRLNGARVSVAIKF